MAYLKTREPETRTTRRIVTLMGVVLWALLSPPGARASDHADPLDLGIPESNLTGLFFFPDGDHMVAAINLRRGLSSPGPYELSPFVVTLHLDLESELSFDDAEDRARYGGTVVDPDGLSSTAQIQIQLEDDASLRESRVLGLQDSESIRIWSGVRDDPFIFPRFFGKNVISIVIRIPMSAFPEGQQDFVVWADVTRASDGARVDHVGRSNRTQLGRLDFLNTLPPSEHVPAILRKLEQTSGIERWLGRFRELAPLASLYHFVLQLRPYDVFPDVMIYSTRFPPGFPNGRRLTDDIVALTCEHGDCDLQELAFFEGNTWPRKTVNDKPFLDDFPYLAEPWPDTPNTSKPPRSLWPIVAAVVALLLAVPILTFWLGYRRGVARG